MDRFDRNRKLLTLFLLCATLAVIWGFPQPKYMAIYRINPSYEGFEEEYAELLPFYEADINDAKTVSDSDSVQKPTRDFIGIDAFDLNQDGIAEIFVWFEGGVICGINICPADIYQRDISGRLKNIDHIIHHGGPEILKSTTNRYHDLAYFWWKYGKEFYIIYKWDGQKYVLFERVPLNQVKKGYK